MNDDVRTEARRARVPLWRIADALGVSEATFTRMMRKKLSEDKRSQIMSIIAKEEKHD